MENGLYDLPQSATESKIYSWPIEYEILRQEDYDLDVRLFFNWIIEK